MQKKLLKKWWCISGKVFIISLAVLRNCEVLRKFKINSYFRTSFIN